MATIADLWVTLGLKSDGFSKGIRSAENEVDSFVSKMAAAGQKMVGIGKGMSLAITTPIAIGAKFAIGEASDLAEAQSAVATVYGDAAKDIHGATGSVAKDLGLSRSEALQAATGFGVFAKGAGLSGDAAVGFSNDLVGASADLASFYNTSSPEVLEAIQSGLTGETEPLRKFGILLNEASLQEYALENGIWDGSTAMTEQQKVLARQGFIMENLGDAQGDFLRTQDSMANRFKIMQKRVKDFAGVLGTAMMPAVEKVMGWLEKFASALEGLSPTMLKWGVIILGVVAAIGPLLIVLGYFLQALAPLGAAFALILSPIGLLIAAIGLLAFAFRGPIFSAIGEVVDRLREFVSDITKVYDRLRQGALVYDEFNDRWVRMGHGASVASALIRAFGSALEDLLGLELSAFFFNIADAVDVFMSSFSAFRDAGANLPTALWMALGDAIGSLIGKDISAWFNDVAIAVGNIKDAAFDFDISALVSALGDLANLTVVPLGEWFLETVAPKVTGWLVTAAGNLWNHLKPLVGWTGDVLAELGAWLLSTAAPAVTGWLISAAGNLWNVLKPLVGWTGDVLASLGEWTLDTAAPVVTGWLNAATTSTWNFIKRAAGWTWDGLADLGAWTLDVAIPTITGWIRELIAGAWTAIKRAAGWVWDGIASFGSWSLNIPTPQITGWMAEVAADIWGGIKTVAGWAEGAVNGAQDIALELTAGAVSLAEGFISGVDAQAEPLIAGQSLGPYQVPAEVEIVPGGGGGEERGGIAGVFFDVVGWAGAIQDSIVSGLTSGNVTEGVRSATRFGALAVVGTVVATFQSVTGTGGDGSRSLADLDVGGIVDGITLPFRTLGTLVRNALLGIDMGLFDAFMVINEKVDLADDAVALFIRTGDIFDGIIGAIEESWDTAIGVMNPTTWSNPFDGLGGTIQGWIDNIPMPSVPEWLKKMASGDIMGAIGSMINSGNEGWGMSAPVTPPGYGPPGGQTQPGTDLNLGDPAVEPVGKAFVAPAPDFSKFLAAHDTAFADANTKGLQFVTDSTDHGVLAADGFNNTFILDPAVAHAGAVQGSLESIFSGIATDATNKGMVAGEGFNSGITQGTNHAVSQAGAAQASMVAIFSGIAASMTNLGMAGGQGFAFGVSSGMAQAVGSAYAGAAQIRGALSSIGNLYGEGYSIGSSLGQGIASGIAGMVGAVAAQAAGIVNAAVAAARNAGAIRSPSKVMAELVGKPLAQGVALGIRQGVREVDRAALGLVPSVRPNSVAGIDAYGATGAGGGIHVSVNFNEPVYGVDGLENAVVDIVVDKVVPAVAAAAQQRDRAIGVRR